MAVRTLIGWTLSSREARTAYREAYERAVLQIAAEFVPEGEQARALADRVMEKMFQRFAQQPLADGHEDYLRAQAYLICLQAVHNPRDAEVGMQGGVAILRPLWCEPAPPPGVSGEADGTGGCSGIRDSRY